MLRKINNMKILETDRLILRIWNDNDLQPMLAINQDPKVMEYFPDLQDLEMTKNFIDKVNAHFENHGYSLYATVRKDTNEFIGFIGLLIADFESHFTPATEIGWRLSSKHWGKGFATEGAKAVLDYAFKELKIPEIVSFTAAGNAKSTVSFRNLAAASIGSVGSRLFESSGDIIVTY